MKAAAFDVLLGMVLLVVLPGCTRSTTPEELLAVIGPQSEEIMQFLARSETTILFPTKTEWHWSRVYIQRGEKIERGCSFESNITALLHNANSEGFKGKLALYSLANDFSTCEILKIEGAPKPPWYKRLWQRFNGA